MIVALDMDFVAEAAEVTEAAEVADIAGGDTDAR
jgi:hypothetical protein